MNQPFLIIFDNLQQLTSIISNYNLVHIFLDESTDDKISQLLENLVVRTKITKTIISPCYANESSAQSLVYRGEDFVIGMGKLHLQSIVKYYSFANNLEYGLVPVKEIAEYSFSKFAFIEDEKFDFFVCEPPAFAFIDKYFFSENDVFKLEKILSYKNIVMYEKEFEDVILKQPVYNLENIVRGINICNGDYRSVIKLYGAMGRVLDSTKTSAFLGCEYVVLSLLNKNKKDICDNLISITNLMARFYECFNKFDIIEILPYYNKHIRALKEQYGLDLSKTHSHMINVFSAEDIHKIKYTIKAYEPHLKEMFNNAKTHFIFSKIKLDSKELEQALALSPSLSGNKNLLRLVRDLGYFENLLK